ncbi:DNA methyltransferase, partial [Aquibium oceanicum]
MNAPAAGSSFSPDAYTAFLSGKIAPAASIGFEVDPGSVNPLLKPMTQAIVPWACRGGRRALFLRFGLHKTSTQLEVLRQCMMHAGGHALQVVPLGVRHEFFLEQAERHPDLELKFVNRPQQMEGQNAPGAGRKLIHLTNYETLRDGKLDPLLFTAASLDEAAVLRGFGGTKTFRNFMATFAGDPRDGSAKHEGVKYRFVATAIPDPNEYVELLAYAAFLGVMDVGEAKTRFFKRDSTKADKLTLHPHKEEEFWLWVSSWALFVQQPSDLGFSDEGYELPPLDIRWHEIASDHGTAGVERDGQGRMFADAAHGVTEAAREKKRSLAARIDKMMQIRAEEPEAHRLIWHDLEDERRAIEAAIPTVKSVWGTLGDEEKEARVVGFARGEFAELATKPVISGSGCNFQRHCSRNVYLGIGFKFHDFYQSLFRTQRYGQANRVRADLIYTEAERGTRRELERKWREFEAQAARMSAIIRKFGLAEQAIGNAMKRSIGVERQVVTDVPPDADRPWRYRLVRNDTVAETAMMDSDSVDLIVTSIPFSTQYEYTPAVEDLGHNEDDARFWRQMDFLIPELLRVLKPGRKAVIHVKDRIVPGGINGLGFQTVSPFSDDCSARFRAHGFALLARVSIGTDVVRENNQTYRLGWSEQCKDGTRMGHGMPEYVLEFRKPQTDRSRGYADRPVTKDKPDFVSIVDGRPTAPGDDDFDARRIRPVAGTGYSRGRWQLDANGVWRSSGDRLLLPGELARLIKADGRGIYRGWKDWALSHVYDRELHVAFMEALDEAGRLPPTFMIAPPHLPPDHPHIRTDVARMRTLNMIQKAKGREMHLCPLQFDIVEPAIRDFTMPGEVVFDPFGGIMTVPYC